MEEKEERVEASKRVIKVAAICGSLRKASSNLGLIRSGKPTPPKLFIFFPSTFAYVLSSFHFISFLQSMNFSVVYYLSKRFTLFLGNCLISCKFGVFAIMTCDSGF
uniref:NADPH:quinone oxidoreductase-like n=1 Tax=Rhizophora mucronata TaxID=61149 RepID=A0A2P2MII9_RHIMU